MQIQKNYEPITLNDTIRGVMQCNGKLKRYAESKTITFQVSNEKTLLDQIYALRYKVFDKEVAMFKGDTMAKIESDKYDAYSWHAFLFIEGDLASYTRMVLDSQYGFPSEQYHPYPLEDIRMQCVEFSRATSTHKWRRSNALWLGFYLALKHCVQQNIYYVLGFSTTPIMNRLKKQNLSFCYIGEPMYAYNRLMHPYIIDIRKSL